MKRTTVCLSRMAVILPKSLLQETPMTGLLAALQRVYAEMAGEALTLQTPLP